ncbi:Sodium/calcium exchanger protein-domain-containing protein [Lasiosphaeria miniovina]|uniref:Sodium/calcium exchanger protein-domain-containing protein n=1 Tax=Lasiosphaeria miniovina TaxID=1954250 RepID=A0AA40DMF5_9PEZI|nr:Sodium/calcium exchanger protein-domain-containing protein [Lasiosphaeria miniovina]KAK0706626.1 Sodium/calcium exchanger protein-domain-containing protein [Lasiosphaeria miniovina]
MPIMPSVDALLFNISSFIAGLFLLEYGADKFIDHTAVVAKRLNVSPTLVGLLTCGAEWEELVVIIVALSQKNSNLALGNLVGSSIANILASFSLGLVFMKKAEFDRSSKIYSTVLLALTSVFLVLLAVARSSLKWLSGSLLIAAFVVYVASVATLIYRGTLTAPEDDSDSDSDSDSDGDSDSDSDSDLDGHAGDSDEDTVGGDNHAEAKDKVQVDEEQGGRRRWGNASGRQLRLTNLSKKSSRPSSGEFMVVKPGKARPKPMRHHLLRLAMGLAALLVSSYIIAHSASAIGNELALSGTVVGTTILSLATTLPEKFVAIMGGVRHQPGIMVANTVGSNIFLVTLCGGVLFIWDDAGQLELGFTVFEVFVMWVSAAIIFSIVIVGGRRWMGFVMLSLYVGFLIVELMNGHNLDDD